MNLIDITLVAETVLSSNVKALNILWESGVEKSNIEVLKSLDTSLTQSEMSTGNYILIVRTCFEHPAKMIKTEIEEYSNKALEELKLLLEELVSSENKVFSIKSSVTKFQ